MGFTEKDSQGATPRKSKSKAKSPDRKDAIVKAKSRKSIQRIQFDEMFIKLDNSSKNQQE